MFKIADLEFEHDMAVLEGFCCGGFIRWGLSIEGRRKERFLGEQWSPRAYIDTVPGLLTRGFTDLSGQSAAWTEKSSADSDENRAVLYVFEHLGIREGRIEFGITSGFSIPFLWKGRCDVEFDEQYGSDLPLLIDAIGEVRRIYSVYPNEEEVRRKLPAEFSRTGRFQQLQFPRGPYEGVIEFGK